MSDAALILRARGGDELAFRRLVDRYMGLMVSICQTYYLPTGTLADMKQIALMGFKEAVDAYTRERRASFRNFAILCVKRELMTAVRLANGYKHRLLNEGVSLSAVVSETDDLTIAEIVPDPTPATDPVEHLEQRETLAEASRVVNFGLSDLERAAVLGTADGQSYRQVAAANEVQVKTVDNARQRAQRKLAAQLGSAA